jgi:hypothetical protein
MKRALLALAGCLATMSIAAHAQTPPAPKEAELLAAGHRRLSGSEIIGALVGNTAYIVFLANVDDAARGSVVRNYFRDAKIRISVPASGPNAGKKLESNWWVEGDLVCAEQRLVMRGHTCSSMYRADSSFYSCVQPGADCRFLWRVVPGNPENI